MYIKLKLKKLQLAGTKNLIDNKSSTNEFKCPNLPYDNLDGLVNLNSKSWFTTVDNFKQRKVESAFTNLKSLSGNSNSIDFNSKYFLEFLGSWRKLIIELGIKAVVQNLKSKYKQFDNLEEIIISDAYGSTNITSDYDLTLSGPGTYLIVKCILEKWKNYDFNLIKRDRINTERSSQKKELIRTTPKTFRDTFDSNFYLVPDLVLNKTMSNILKNTYKIRLYQVKKINDNWSKYTIIPGKENYDLEINALNNKLNSVSIDKQINDYNNTNNNKLLQSMDNSELRKAHTELLNSHPVSIKYNKLLELAKTLDEFLYSQNGINMIIFKSGNDVIKHVMDMLENSIEGYYCLSTIIAVVYGIQAKKIEDVKIFFNDYKGGWVIAAIENLIDLFIHLKDHNKNIDDNIILKVSKYIYRIYFCLDYYFDGKNNKIKNRMNIAKKLVDKRGGRAEQAKSEIEALKSLIQIPNTFNWNEYKKVFIDDYISDISSKIIKN